MNYVLLLSIPAGFIIGILLNRAIGYFLNTYKCDSIRNLFPYVEIITAFLTWFIIWVFGISIPAFAALIFCYTLIILAFVDLETQLLPDILTKPLIVLGLVQGYFGILVDMKDSIAGAIIGYFLFWTINTLFRIIRKKDGMGYGDFKLLSAIGAWIGVYQLPLVIMLSSIAAIIVAVVSSLLMKKEISRPIPFGPSLIIAGIVGLCWGKEIIRFYLNFI